MEELKIDGNWSLKKGLIQQRFKNVTDQDLDFELEKTDEFLETLSVKTGLTKELLIEQINKF